MTLGLYEERARRRRGRRWAVLRWILVLVALGAVAVFAYESGRSLAVAENAALRDEMTALNGSLEDSQKQRARLELELQNAQQAKVQFEQRYARDVAQGASARLLELLQGKLAEGVSEDRLETVLAAVENERDCDEESVTKRFILTTPLTGGENNEVRFVDSTLVVSGEADSALNAEGKPEAWFDEAKPVTLRFQMVGGEGTEITGVLPLNRSVIIGDREHIFTVAAGPRGFVEVTGRSCVYP